jgi:tetratricopeptide (TPR) repeat protein
MLKFYRAISNWQRVVKCGLLLLALVYTALPVRCADEVKPLNLGISAYNQGNYSEALSQLGQALPTDFNNPNLHYYLGNTYLRLHQKDSAIREFRIAYALEPEKEVGQLSKKALDFLEMPGKMQQAKNGNGKEGGVKPQLSKEDQTREKALKDLEEQTARAKIQSQALGNGMAESAVKRGNDYLDRYKQDLLKSLEHYRRGQTIKPPLSDEQVRELDKLSKLYGNKHQSYYQQSQGGADEIQKTGDNLKNLLLEKNSKSGTRLSPVGTNLYVRNYIPEKKPMVISGNSDNEMSRK